MDSARFQPRVSLPSFLRASSTDTPIPSPNVSEIGVAKSLDISNDMISRTPKYHVAVSDRQLEAKGSFAKVAKIMRARVGRRITEDDEQPQCSKKPSRSVRRKIKERNAWQ